MAIKQLTVFVQNSKGTIVSVTDTLAKNNINLRALSIAETEDFGNSEQRMAWMRGLLWRCWLVVA